MPVSELYVGLMSGTSLDGIDAVLVDFSSGSPALRASKLLTFSPELKEELTALQQSSVNELSRAAHAANALAQRYSVAVAQVLTEADVAPSSVAAIGMHGQTIRHRPELGYTLQIGNAALLAELSGICVVSDFRSRDVAAGGQGAPLVPAFHEGVFGGGVHRTVVNIGGIANVTDLPVDGIVRGWDTGPGNVLMDYWVGRHRGLEFDAGGQWANTGQVSTKLLERLQADPYFAAQPPKSTGRDLFRPDWLAAILESFSLPHEDVQATLLELTARSIADAITQQAPLAREVYICGGGARNTALMRRLGDLLAPRMLAGTDLIGLHPDWVEAVAFAWLARQCLMGLPGNLPAVTGAKGQRVLGAIHPA
jgi:anhydro-N-acetylmuramic acid kinase